MLPLPSPSFPCSFFSSFSLSLYSSCFVFPLSPSFPCFLFPSLSLFPMLPLPLPYPPSSPSHAPPPPAPHPGRAAASALRFCRRLSCPAGERAEASPVLTLPRDFLLTLRAVGAPLRPGGEGVFGRLWEAGRGVSSHDHQGRFWAAYTPPDPARTPALRLPHPAARLRALQHARPFLGRLTLAACSGQNFSSLFAGCSCGCKGGGGEGVAREGGGGKKRREGGARRLRDVTHNPT